MNGMDRLIARLTVTLVTFGIAAFIGLYIVAPTVHAAADAMNQTSELIAETAAR
jgi:hypothetical protein